MRERESHMENSNEFKNDVNEEILLNSNNDDGNEIRIGFEAIRKETQNEEQDGNENDNNISSDIHPSSLPPCFPKASTSGLSSILLAASMLAGPLTSGASGGVIEQLPPSVLLAAFAATEGFKHITNGYLQQQQVLSHIHTYIFHETLPWCYDSSHF